MSTSSAINQQPREDIDLNKAPPDVILDEEATEFVHQPIDVEAFDDDDDVILAKRSDSLEAQNNSRRCRKRTIADVELHGNSRIFGPYSPSNNIALPLYLRASREIYFGHKDYLRAVRFHSSITYSTNEPFPYFDPHIGFEGSASSQNMSTSSAINQQPREDIDLNKAPPDVTLDEEATEFVHQPIDVEAFDDDDDVILATRSDFLEAQNNSRRRRKRTIADVELHGNSRSSYSPSNNIALPLFLRATREIYFGHKDYLWAVRFHSSITYSTNEPFPYFDPHIGFEGSASSQQEKYRKSAEFPKELVVNCPICIEPFKEAVSTRCGHIFCKRCIRAAVKKQGNCPTCRAKVNARGLKRVFLPTPASP